jgi:hypothetical protein
VWLAALVSTVGAAAAFAQDNPFAAPKKSGFELEALVRHEWTRKIFDNPDETHDEDRWRLRALPRVTAGGDRFKIVVGGDFNWDTHQRNVDPKEDGVKPTLLRDNYDSRSARLDLAFADLQPLGWLSLEGGRFPMPSGVTEMLWDKDLRPQGGSVRLATGAIHDIESLSGTFLITQGGHVFDVGQSRLMMGTLTARLVSANQTKMELNASLLDFTKLDEIEPMIRRQNKNPDGTITSRFRVADLVGRMVIPGGMPMQLVGDYAWNTAADTQNRGIWVAVVLGSLTQSRARLDYTYARVDRNATVAAFATDDFFWGTGWEGHRVELGTRTHEHISGHIIGQIQRFKDSLKPEEQRHWVERLRVELRFTP